MNNNTTRPTLAAVTVHPIQLLKGRYREEITNWLFDGTTPGSFVWAVLSNDLTQAVYNADEQSLADLMHLVTWVHTYVTEGQAGSSHAGWASQIARGKALGPWRGFYDRKAKDEWSALRIDVDAAWYAAL
jgi:hypothetical protein